MPPWQARVLPKPVNDNKTPMTLRLLRGGVLVLLVTVIVAVVTGSIG